MRPARRAGPPSANNAHRHPSKRGPTADNETCSARSLLRAGLHHACQRGTLMPLNRTAATLAAAALLATLAACGGGSGASAGSGGDTPPPPSGGSSGVQGVATPTSV